MTLKSFVNFFCNYPNNVERQVLRIFNTKTCLILSFAMYKGYLALFATTEIDSAAANQQSQHENQAAGINRQTEISHFATAAAQIQDDKQDPSAVAAAQASAFFAAAAAAVAIVEHSVEHIFTSVSPIIRL